MLETGDILVGRYEVDSLIGRGGMSSVFAGFDRTLGREVAIKVLAAGLADDRVFVERFDREARAAASLSHRNIVAVFDTGEDDGERFIVMERVHGQTLATMLRHGPLAVERAVEIAVGVGRALGAAHARGIVHRDVKPGNVMVGAGGQVKVLDFGIARALAASTLTRPATVIGTAGYLSPEQAEGGTADARSDLYGLGCVLYEMLTGRPPFVADSAAALAQQHLTRSPDPPSLRRPEVSVALDDLVLRCLAKDPAARYAQADALCAALLAVPGSTDRAPSDADLARGLQPVGIASAAAIRARRAASRAALSARSRGRSRLLAALLAAVLLVAIVLALDHGSGGSGGKSAAQTVALQPAHAAAAKRVVTQAHTPGASANLGGHVGSVAATAGVPPPAQGRASAASSSPAPPDPAGALSALVLADRRQGLIDSGAAKAIFKRSAALLRALSIGDPGRAARDLSEFAKRVDQLAADGGIATPAVAAALMAAATAVASTIPASAPTEQGAPPSSPADGASESDSPAPGNGRAHRHDGGQGPHD